MTVHDDDRPTDAERVLTWAGLLARWMEFARSAVALPDDDEGDRWRASVVPIITLHAVSMALGELELLPETEWPLARDRASIAIADANVALRAAWRGVELPDSIVALRSDAQHALERAQYAGATELRWPGPGIFEMPAVDHATAQRDPATRTLCIAAPGTPMMPGEPIAWWIGGPGIAVDGCIAERVEVPRQVYRVLDRDGCAERDLVVPMTAELPAGLPLLVPLLEHGEPVGQMPDDTDRWRQLQWSALPNGAVPVEVCARFGR